MAFTNRLSTTALPSLLLVLCGNCAFGIPTVGVYDENVFQPNSVDFNATGNSFTAAQFGIDVSAAHAADLGGVIDGTAVGVLHEFGTSLSKTLELAFVSGTNVAGGAPSAPQAVPISKTGAFASSFSGGFDFTDIDFVQIIGGDPGERVVQMGLTVLSSTQDFGTVRVEGRLAVGGSLISSRTITEAAAQGDTFFGLEAPAGDHFTGFSLRYFGTPTNPLQWFDDIGFVTAVVPEPSSLLLLGMGGLVFMSRQRQMLAE